MCEESWKCGICGKKRNDVDELLLRIEELELAAIPVDDRLEKMQAAYENKIKWMLEEKLRLKKLLIEYRRMASRMARQREMFRRQLKGLHKRVRIMQAYKYNWRTYNGTDATLPRENVECVVWPEWKQRNNLAPVELNLYHENGAWITEEDEKRCSECATRHNTIYDIDNTPPKPHLNCRCYFEPVKKEGDALD